MRPDLETRETISMCRKRTANEEERDPTHSSVLFKSNNSQPISKVNDVLHGEANSESPESEKRRRAESDTDNVSNGKSDEL